MFRQGFTECRRLQNLKVPKVRQKEIEILTDEEIERIFATMNVDTVPGHGPIFPDVGYRAETHRGRDPEVR